MSIDEICQLMKVLIAKEVIACDVSPVAMFELKISFAIQMKRIMFIFTHHHDGYVGIGGVEAAPLGTG